MDCDFDVDAYLFDSDCYRTDYHNIDDIVNHCMVAGDNDHYVDDEGNENDVDIDFQSCQSFKCFLCLF